MSVDLRSMMAGAQAMPSMTAQMEAMKLQQTFATLQIAQNLVMSNVLLDDEKLSRAEGEENDAKKLRATAKALIQTFLDGQEITQD